MKKGGAEGDFFGGAAAGHVAELEMEEKRVQKVQKAKYYEESPWRTPRRLLSRRQGDSSPKIGEEFFCPAILPEHFFVGVVFVDKRLHLGQLVGGTHIPAVRRHGQGGGVKPEVETNGIF